MLLHLSMSVLLLATTAVYGFGYGRGYGHNGYFGDDRNSPMSGPRKICRPPNMPGLILTPDRDNYKDKETIQLSCEEGYKFTGDRTEVQCRYFPDFFPRGVFMPGIFPGTCEELPMCRKPRALGLMVNGSKYSYEEGENITISCEDGFELVGPDTFTCKIVQDYFGEKATFGSEIRKACQEIRDCLPPIQDGLIIEPLQRSYQPGENISLACEDGYEISVEDISTCKKSGFFKLERKEMKGDQKRRDDFFIYFNRVCVPIPECEAPDFDGMVVSPMKDSYEVGESIEISCEDGYELKGESTRVCGYGSGYNFIENYLRRLHGQGTFSPRPNHRTCVEKPQCSAPQPQDGLVLTPAKESYDIGETVELSCEEGYQLTKLNSTKCERKVKYIAIGHVLVKFADEILAPWSDSALCEKIPSTTQPETEASTATTPARITFSIRPELTPETMPPESPETEASGSQEEDEVTDEDGPK